MNISQFVNSCKMLFLNCFVRPFLIRKPRYDKRYNVCICAIFKNEAQFFLEWLTYYEIVGVDHFYLYDNGSDDNYKEIIQPFIDNGMVTLIDWPYPQGQIKAYEHYYKTYRGETQWVSFLDLDEFVVPRNDSTILEWLKKYDCRPVNLIYWKMFGTSGKLKHDYERLVTEQYTVSWEGLYEYGKCFVNTDYDIARFDGSVHHETRVIYPIFGFFKMVLPPINQFGYFATIAHPVKWAWKPTCPEIQINHYGKSWDIYDSKRRKTDSVFEKNPRVDFNYFLVHERKNTNCDYTVFKYVTQLHLYIKNVETKLAE